MRYQILEALVTDLKNSDQKLLLLNTFFVFFLTMVFALCFCSFVDFDVFATHRYTIIVIYCIVVMISSYYLSAFLLSRFFKTNNLLKLLLKDTLHELNIPLSVIKANTQMLKSQTDKDKTLKKLERINLACDELYGLYQDVDYYIKKETKYEIREAFFLDDLIHDESEKFKVLYPHVALRQEVEKLQIYTDRRGFVKVINNLIANALKYNQDDHDVFIYTRGNNLIIEDHGVGMSESELFVIFDRYYQGNSKKDGFGIGLSIVKAFCDEYKIQIKIESQLGKGTKIYLDLDRILSQIKNER
ncbi:sensor histidine kinase [Sulfurospirillum sp. 1612]|uniref:sensor histidine kinase n=1 Tax=Sulfurospirillum sp. 1612 TaxID=3094835 RepID=UPI002F92C7D9